MLRGALANLCAGSQVESECLPQLIQKPWHAVIDSTFVGSRTDRLATFALHRRMMSSRFTAMNS